MPLDNNTSVKTIFNSGIVFQILYIIFCWACYILMYMYIVIDLTRLVTVFDWQFAWMFSK